ncbi:MAG: hypothetical protein UHM23_08905 [Clostridia bacterium]|nr:hypothetical protein [Clostridia bacterium]
MSEVKTLYISVEIKTSLPIEAVKEHLALYCEKMGDVKMTSISTSKEAKIWHSTK